MEQTIKVLEGGCVASGSVEQKQLIGIVSQVAWAEQIKASVNAEFDRVANAIKATSVRHTEEHQSDTCAVIAILEEKRAEVMAKEPAGYFIQAWQELRDKVRLMIIHDPRHKAIKANRKASDEARESI